MRIAISSATLALGLIAGAAFVAAPVTPAHAVQKNGFFGGTWGVMGPTNNRHVQRYNRRHGPGSYAYYGPRPYYGPRYYSRYDYGPHYYRPRAGVSVGIGF